jgi:WD40 repeat protein
VYPAKGGDGSHLILLWEITKAKWERQIEGCKPMPVCFSADGRRLAFGTDNFQGTFGRDKGVPAKLVVWDVSKWVDVKGFTFGSVWDCVVHSLALSRDGSLIAAGGTDNPNPEAHVIDVRTGKRLLKVPGATQVCFAPGGRHVLVGLGNDVVEYDLGTGKPVRTFKGHSEAVTCVACSRDGRWLAAGSGGSANAVRVWEREKGGEGEALGRHDKPVTCVAVSADGRRVLSGGQDNTARLWERATGMEAQRYPHADRVSAVALSPGGKRALTASWDKTVKLWQLPP